ncbi:Metallo-beta-lactamase superfamily protein [Roseovarius pacificus]|uniref:Metallo-beta-lactamase superfamily protein n=1 Tax=Roseovarius pacificus TaxID=337701 RepID=A0A1M7JDC8_9RHOB|nr:N-acyl homoserine lactonase family protein [Roseovarius pacificus]GGO61926.1 MBL fold metallo-hydrolase [Roseovarius pacificus]SHM50986.1 Metallo-beta-lactamase superfamily protein [Roseovarius pacificus]
MKMHVLDGGRLQMRRRIYVPDADKTETIELPVIAILFRHPEGNVLFDTGCHPSVSEDAEARWGKLAGVMTPIGAHSQNVVDSLSAMGLQPSDIDVVVNSHFHPDHCGCNEFFTEARFVVHEAELAAAKAPDAPTQGYLPREWDHSMPMKTVGEGHDVMGDGRLICVHLPGHTPGLIGLLAELEKTGKVLCVSDAVSLRRNLDNDEIPKNAGDPEALLASYARIREFEAAGAMVICGHDDEQVRRLKMGEDAYD